jgi:hypothetical protein
MKQKKKPRKHNFQSLRVVSGHGSWGNKSLCIKCGKRERGKQQVDWTGALRTAPSRERTGRGDATDREPEMNSPYS